jgi:hypothetical protein
MRAGKVRLKGEWQRDTKAENFTDQARAERHMTSHYPTEISRLGVGELPCPSQEL